MGEFLGFVTAQTIGGNAQDLGPHAERWRKANDHIRQLVACEAGIADTAPIIGLTADLVALRDQVYADPIYRRAYQIVPAEIALVELDRLVVFQKHINLEYVGRLRHQLGTAPTPEAIFRFCLPFDHPIPPVSGMRVAQNAFTFISPSADLRFLELASLESSKVLDYSPSGPVSGIIAAVVGFGSNFLNAIHAEGRLVLNNGSHRAYALRELGITHVPCIVQHVSRREELEVVGSGDVPAKPDQYLKDPRPPLLKDYFDPTLRTILQVPRRHRQVTIKFGIETVDVPAS